MFLVSDILLVDREEAWWGYGYMLLSVVAQSWGFMVSLVAGRIGVGVYLLQPAYGLSYFPRSVEDRRLYIPWLDVSRAKSGVKKGRSGLRGPV